QGVTGSEPSSSSALESFEPKENVKAGVETVPVGWSERNKDEGDKSPLMAVARDGDLRIIGWRWSQTGSAPRHELSGRQGSIEDGELAGSSVLLLLPSLARPGLSLVIAMSLFRSA